VSAPWRVGAHRLEADADRLEELAERLELAGDPAGATRAAVEAAEARRAACLLDRSAAHARRSGEKPHDVGDPRSGAVSHTAAEGAE
jgi:hypothetical protein